MTEKLYTLEELWNINGEQPFDAVDNDEYIFHCIGMAPAGIFRASGWGPDGRSDIFTHNEAVWKLHKSKPRMVAWMSMNGYSGEWNEVYMEEGKTVQWSKYGNRMLKSEWLKKCEVVE